MRTVLIVLLTLLLLAGLALVFAGFHMARQQFRRRFQGGGDYFPYFSQLHPGWCREPISFSGSQGDTLRGFLFSYPEHPPKALLVVYHGYGMSLDDYLPECEYFCRQDYLVLAFDGSGTGHSDGILRGLPQHILDLQACLRHICADPQLGHLPLLLYGHSWGGYGVDCIGATEPFPVRGIVSASAFYNSLSALAPYTHRHYGPLAPLPLLGVRLYQRLHFGRLCGLTAADGLSRQSCPVFIVQSDDDSILPFSQNYRRLYRRFRQDPRFTFLPLTGRNHNITTPPEADREKRRLLKLLRQPVPPQEARDQIQLLKTQVDYDLLRRFGDFLDSCLKP